MTYGRGLLSGSRRSVLCYLKVTGKRQERLSRLKGLSLYPGTFVTECKRTERRATRTLILLSGLRSEEQRNRLARGIHSLLSPSQVSPSLLQHFQSGSVNVTPEQHDNVMYIALQSIVIVLLSVSHPVEIFEAIWTNCM